MTQFKIKTKRFRFQQLDRLLREIINRREEILIKTVRVKESDTWSYCSILPAIFEEEIIYYEEFDQYQGEWVLITKASNEVKIYQDYYGSCSGCDFLEDYKVEMRNGGGEEYGKHFREINEDDEIFYEFNEVGIAYFKEKSYFCPQKIKSNEHRYIR